MKAVVDTNVIVSAFMNTNGTPAKIVSLILNEKIVVLHDNRIIFEYREVLSRDEFGFNMESINDMMDFIMAQGEYIQADYLKIKFTDEADKKFYEVYKSGNAQCLITGNKKHFPKESTILNPKEFLEKFVS